LIETMIAVCVLCFGLLAAGQMLFVAAGSASLARSQEIAALVAQSKLGALGELFDRDPGAADLREGNHGPDHFEAVDPAANRIMNRFGVTWVVAPLEDPRPGKRLKARRVVVTVTPVDGGGRENFRPLFNKSVTMETVVWTGTP
jgi:Tfp pilus assembly protein PilV